jgi:hypothetical protein
MKIRKQKVGEIMAQNTLKRTILERFQPEIRESLLNFVSLYIGAAILDGVNYVIITNAQKEQAERYAEIRRYADRDANLPNGAADIFTRVIKAQNGVIAEMPRGLINLITRDIRAEYEIKNPGDTLELPQLTEDLAAEYAEKELAAFREYTREQKNKGVRIAECLIYSRYSGNFDFGLTLKEAQSAGFPVQIGKITPAADGLNLRVKLV